MSPTNIASGNLARPTAQWPAPPSRPAGATLTLEDRRSLILLIMVLVSNLLLLGSTVTLVAFSRQGFNSFDAVDPLTMIKTVARGLCVVFAAVLFIRFRLKWRDVFTGGTRWLLAYFAFALGTAVYSANPAISWTRAISFISILGYGTVLVQAFAKDRSLRSLWGGLYIVYGFWMLAVLGSSLVFHPAASMEGRWGALYAPNLTASVAGVVLVWSFVRVQRDGWSLQPLFFSAASMLLMIMTVSRGGLVAALATCAICAVRMRRTATTIFAGVTVLVVSALVYTMMNGGDPEERLMTYLARGQDKADVVALTGRVPLYKFLLTEQFPEHPIFGVGFQMLSEEGTAPAGKIGIVLEGPRSSRGWHPNHAHNALLQTLIGTGLIGLLIYVIAWGKVLKSLWAAEREKFPLADEALFVMIFVLIHAMIDTTLSSTVDPPFILATFACGIAVLAERARRDARAQQLASVAELA
jgi:O-antigen ligase